MRIWTFWGTLRQSTTGISTVCKGGKPHRDPDGVRWQSSTSVPVKTEAKAACSGKGGFLGYKGEALWWSLVASLLSWLSGKESACQCRRHGFNPWIRKIPWKRKWQLTPVFLPGKSHGQRSLAGPSPSGHEELGDD